MGPRHLEALQLFEGAVINALAGISQALETLKREGGGNEGVAGGAGLDLRILSKVGVGGVHPEVGFDATHAPEAPFVVDESVDEEPLDGVARAVLLVIFGGEFAEIGGGFVEHDLMWWFDAVLQWVEKGCGFLGEGCVLFWS